MNFNIYIDDQLGEQLTDVAKTSNKSRNAIIREAVSMWLKVNDKAHWPDDVLSYSGISDIPSFESHRDELMEAKDDPFA